MAWLARFDDVPYLAAKIMRVQPDPPTLAQRVAACQAPAERQVMHQTWTDLLFLHWEYPAATIQATLPPGLWVDTFAGRAFIGVVPFFMRHVRPVWFPAIPGISNFMEINLRTYVYDDAGVPGVWFFSLDANQRLAVNIARRFFHLPYEHARMSAARLAGGAIAYQSLRRNANPLHAQTKLTYAPGPSLAAPAAESLEFFLAERYRLYAHGRGFLWRGAVAHSPYPLTRTELSSWDDHLLLLNRFPAPGRPPDHQMMSPGVTVRIYPLQPVPGSPSRQPEGGATSS